MSQKRKVLIVDDDAINRLALEKSLQDDYILQSAPNGLTALDCLENFQPDLILLDLMMPGMDGYEFCRLVRSSEEHRYRKIIVVSGLAGLDNRLKSYEIGADDFLLKPFDEYELKAKITVFLRLKYMEESASELARANKKLSRRNEELSHLSYRISHDLKSPVVTIEGFLALLVKDLKNGDTTAVDEDLSEIGKAVDYSKRLLADLLRYSKSGHSTESFSKIEPRLMVEDILSSFGREFPSSDLLTGLPQMKPADGLDEAAGKDFPRVKMAIDGSLPVIFFSPTLLREIFQNIIQNAVRHMGPVEHPEITIRGRKIGGGTLFSVTDNGRGIEKRFQKRVFQLFDRFSLDSEGSGLGLSICHRILENHGGRIWVESESNQGCTFFFTIPDGKMAVSGESFES